MMEKLREEKAENKRLIKEMFEMNPRGDFSRGAIKRYSELLDRINEIDIFLSLERPEPRIIEIMFEDLPYIASIDGREVRLT